MLILTNHPEQTQQGGGFQLQSNALQNSRAIYYNILNFFEEGVEKFQQNKILWKRFYGKDFMFDILDLISIYCLRILLPKDITVQGYYYSRILLTQGLIICCYLLSFRIYVQIDSCTSLETPTILCHRF